MYKILSNLLLTTAAVHAANVIINVGPGQTYTPSQLNINVGDSVTWYFQEDGHSVTSSEAVDSCHSNKGQDGSFNSNHRKEGDTFSLLFNANGIYPFHSKDECKVGMQGVVIVGNGSGAGSDSEKEGNSYHQQGNSYPQQQQQPNQAYPQQKGQAYPPPSSVTIDSVTATAIPTASTTPNASPYGGKPGSSSPYGSSSSGPYVPNYSAGPVPTSTAPTSPAVPSTYVIKVGDGGLNFTPNKLTIPPGSTVEWQFTGSKHNVHQVSDGKTCSPMSNGFATPADMTSGSFTQTFSNPGKIWYICTVGQHCQNGMRGIITVDPNALTNSSSSASSSSSTTSTTTSGNGNSVENQTGKSGFRVAPFFTHLFVLISAVALLGVF